MGSGIYRIEETIIKTKFCNTQTCIVQYFCTIYVLKIICLKSLISRTYVTLRTAD
ncbi:hypothetical protein C0J52_08365 [Blattella germanica]|nr:hypothetical protein C0J52_08365 [Blattella germanica]